MAIVQAILTFNGMNTSVQIGDIVYYSININPSGGFESGSVADTKRFGEIVAIDGNSLTVQYDDSLISPPPNAFILFAKDKQVNTSSLSGYYANVTFRNNSSTKVEIFSVGANVTPSSK